MFRSHTKRALCLLALLLVTFGCAVQGQDSRKVPISFLPPPLENATYSLGIYEAKSGKLVRRLQEIAPESAFTVGLNGLMTSWDGKDETGKAVPPGKYAARGYAVGPLKIEGLAILGNDWAADDASLRVKTVNDIALVPEDDGLAAVTTMADASRVLLRIAGKDGTLLWKKPLPWASPEDKTGTKTARAWGVLVDEGVISVGTGGIEHSYQVASGDDAPNPVNDDYRRNAMAGKDDTVWLTTTDGVWQLPAGAIKKDNLVVDKMALRHLAVPPDGLLPTRVSASKVHDRLYILEEKPSWQRVRGLSWDSTQVEDGKTVSTWKTLLEKNIRSSDGPIVTEGPHLVVVPLEENPLLPGKAQNVKLAAKVDEKGSYLTTADGLRLRRISENLNLEAAMLQKGKTASQLTFLQTDGAAWDEFSIEGAKNMMEFDAGEIEMTADGEKVHSKKAAESPDL